MLRLLLFVSWLLVSTLSIADDQPQNREADIIQALTDLSAQLPQQYLSLDAVAEHNDYDENRIIKWVAKNIQYSPSPGYQLTPENALLTASGNALEQAMLLQNLLTQAGFEVRISRTVLDEETAVELLKQSFVSSPVHKWQFDDVVRDEYLKKFAVLYGEEENAFLGRYLELAALTPWGDSKLYKESRKLSETLYKAIENQGAWQFSDAPLRPWIEIAQDYFFVKYRLSPGDEWLQAHPAFVEKAPIIETSTYFTEDISSQYHQITFQAFITRQIDGQKTETIAVTPQIKRSSQQLFKRQLEFATAPSNFKEASDTNSLKLLYESKYFVPIVDDAVDDDTRAFGLDGKDYAAKEVLGSTQQFMKAVTEKMSKSTSALGELSSQASEPTGGLNPESSSVLLDYYFLVGWTAPSGDSIQIKRFIYQRQEKERNKSIVEDITQRLSLAAEPGILSPAAESNQQLNAQISVIQLMQKAIEQDFSETQTINQISQWSKSQKDFRFNNTLALSQHPNNDQQIFSSVPMLAVIWERQDYESEQLSGTTSFDYLINAAQVVRIADNALTTDASATLALGVWSTYSEALVQAKGGQDTAPPSRDELPRGIVSAAGQFNKSITTNQGFEIVTQASHLVSRPQLSSSAKALLADELSKNPQYLFVLPKQRPESGYLAYYRIDNQTGETLGYSEFGRGISEVEYAKMLGVAIAYYKYLQSLAKCTGMGNTAEGRSCLFCTGALAAITANGLVSTGATVVAVAAGATAGSICAPYM